MQAVGEEEEITAEGWLWGFDRCANNSDPHPVTL